MEQLISDIEAFCAGRGISPQKFLREAINAQWGQWQKWKDGDASPTMRVADRLRAMMTDQVAPDASRATCDVQKAGAAQ